MINKFIHRLSFVVAMAAPLICTSSLMAGSKSFRFADVESPDFFPILPWDPQHTWYRPLVNESNGVDTIAECNFNMAGFVLPKDLLRCKKLGLGAIVLPTDAACTNFDYFLQWKKLSDAEIDRRVRDMVRGAGRNPAVAGFFITDEPGVSDFAALGKAVAAVKKYAPGKLAYINLFPDYATLGAPDRSQLGTSNYTEYLERFVAEVRPQCLSYDNYMVQYSMDQRDRAKAGSYYRNLLEFRRVAQKHNLPCLNIVSSNQVRPGHPPPSPANLLLQAYTTLAAGYKGVSWYTYYGRGYRYAPIGMDGQKTLTWEYLREVNRQIATLAPVLCRLRSTGVFFTTPALADDLPALPGAIVSAVTCQTPVMVGEFSDAAGATYAMIVNLSLERSAKIVPTPKLTGARIEMISAVDGRRRALDLAKEELWLNAGQGTLLRIGN
jgi:hypothetical protein